MAACEQQKNYFDLLPEELVQRILSSITDFKSLVRCMSVSKAFREYSTRLTSLSILCPVEASPSSSSSLPSYDDKLRCIFAMVKNFKDLQSLIVRMGQPKKEPHLSVRCMRYAEIGISVEKFVFMAVKSGDFSEFDQASMVLEDLMGLRSGGERRQRQMQSENDRAAGKIDGKHASEMTEDSSSGGNCSESLQHAERCCNNCKMRSSEVTEDYTSLRNDRESLHHCGTCRNNYETEPENDDLSGKVEGDHACFATRQVRKSSVRSPGTFLQQYRASISEFNLRQVVAPSNDVLKCMLPVIHFAILQGFNELRDALPPFLSMFPQLQRLVLVDMAENITIHLRKDQIEDIRTLHLVEMDGWENWVQDTSNIKGSIGGDTKCQGKLPMKTKVKQDQGLCTEQFPEETKIEKGGTSTESLYCQNLQERRSEVLNIENVRKMDISRDDRDRCGSSSCSCRESSLSQGRSLSTEILKHGACYSNNMLNLSGTEFDQLSDSGCSTSSSLADSSPNRWKSQSMERKEMFGYGSYYGNDRLRVSDKCDYATDLRCSPGELPGHSIALPKWELTEVVRYDLIRGCSSSHLSRNLEDGYSAKDETKTCHSTVVRAQVEGATENACCLTTFQKLEKSNLHTYGIHCKENNDFGDVNEGIVSFKSEVKRETSSQRECNQHLDLGYGESRHSRLDGSHAGSSHKRDDEDRFGSCSLIGRNRNCPRDGKLVVTSKRPFKKGNLNGSCNKIVSFGCLRRRDGNLRCIDSTWRQDEICSYKDNSSCEQKDSGVEVGQKKSSFKVGKTNVHCSIKSSQIPFGAELTSHRTNFPQASGNMESAIPSRHGFTRESVFLPHSLNIMDQNLSSRIVGQNLTVDKFYAEDLASSSTIWSVHGKLDVKGNRETTSNSEEIVYASEMHQDEALLSSNQSGAFPLEKLNLKDALKNTEGRLTSEGAGSDCRCVEDRTISSSNTIHRTCNENFAESSYTHVNDRSMYDKGLQGREGLGLTNQRVLCQNPHCWKDQQDHHARRERTGELLKKRQRDMEREALSFDYTFWRADQVMANNYCLSDISMCIATKSATPLGEVDKDILTFAALAGPLLVATVSHVNKQHPYHSL